ncbi:hypothetical protein M514_09099 [Trichuris suis]|uniref:Uncharacterized protein n=1 Tax=Trichuris suis TaxID=68888 RepID=A0A085N5J7_9BILA|nr:hypothetical protein M513_09099 [Trichuris suis]KFD64743.1 hypothetical protein M514_09099 [Trichuris suis]
MSNSAEVAMPSRRTSVGSLVEYMRLATLTVSPKTAYMGTLVPTTPHTTVPLLMPLFISTSMSGNWFLIASCNCTAT